jgi:hypothetical protein
MLEDMSSIFLTETVASRDAGAELTRTYSQRVAVRNIEFMSGTASP